jgi:hypothetical protein
VKQAWEIQGVKDVTYAFASIGGFVAVLIAIGWASEEYEDECCAGLFAGLGMTVVSAAGLMGLLAAWYSDWVLGVMSGNLAGGPGGGANRILWAIYFVSKRLPMFIQ